MLARMGQWLFSPTTSREQPFLVCDIIHGLGEFVATTAGREIGYVCKRAFGKTKEPLDIYWTNLMTIPKLQKNPFVRATQFLFSECLLFTPWPACYEMPEHAPLWSHPSPSLELLGTFQSSGYLTASNMTQYT